MISVIVAVRTFILRIVILVIQEAKEFEAQSGKQRGMKQNGSKLRLPKRIESREKDLRLRRSKRRDQGERVQEETVQNVKFQRKGSQNENK